MYKRQPLIFVVGLADFVGMITMAKAITNGVVPLGAVASREEIYDTIVNASPTGAVEFFHGYTYSAIPVSMAAGLAMQDIFEKEKLFDRAKDMSPYFLDGLFSLKDLDIIGDIRGYGMMGESILEWMNV